MAFQSVPETAEIVLGYTLNLESMFNVMHAQLVGGYDLGDLQALADAVDIAVDAEMLPLQTNECTYDETTVRGLEFENDQVAIANANSGIGQRASPSLPGNVTISIKKGSAFTGRSARGRMFWIGLARDMLATNENQVVGSSVTGIVDALEAVRDAISATAWSPVIVSRFSNGVKRTEGTTFFWSTTSAVNANVDSSRGRLTT